MNMESSLAATVEAQGKQLLEQQQRIRELEKRLDSLAGKVVAVEGDDNNCNEGAAPVQVGGVHVSEVPKENNEFNSAALYEFDQSMWDAALLLFFRKGSNWVEKLILVIGCGINYFLQLSLLLTISVNMLDTPYSPATIQEMLAWRVEQAQANSQFDNVRGKSLATRLCNQELWTYEQEEYKLMYAYLYKDIPGSLLSTLGIIMWVLTIMREYRRSMEQALAVIHLPALEEGKKSEFEWDREAEEWTVVGMNRVKRILALVLLSLPRLGVTVCLGLIGCQYLAQTANLADIVLNAVALAFVMDVDELVADVLLTERLRSILPKIKPLSCGVRKRGRCCPFKDIVRYALTTGQLVARVGCRMLSHVAVTELALLLWHFVKWPSFCRPLSSEAKSSTPTAKDKRFAGLVWHLAVVIWAVECPFRRSYVVLSSHLSRLMHPPAASASPMNGSQQLVWPDTGFPQNTPELWTPFAG